MRDRIPLWHQCVMGNHFGSYADQNIQCPACGVTEEMPKPRYIYDDYDMPPTLINRDTYPDLVNRWEPGQVGGRQ